MPPLNAVLTTLLLPLSSSEGYRIEIPVLTFHLSLRYHVIHLTDGALLVSMFTLLRFPANRQWSIYGSHCWFGPFAVGAHGPRSGTGTHLSFLRAASQLATCPLNHFYWEWCCLHSDRVEGQDTETGLLPPPSSRETWDLLQKQVVSIVSLYNRETGFYSAYLLVPKKTGDIKPILDLHHKHFTC